jgi:hypothetical protein
VGEGLEFGDLGVVDVAHGVPIDQKAGNEDWL